MENLNTYDAAQFAKYFPTTPWYKTLMANLPIHARLHYDWYWHHPNGRGRDVTYVHEDFPVAVFYYLDFVFRTHATVIPDIGCGQNMFKKIADSRIFGYDPCTDKYIPNCVQTVDEISSFNSAFVDRHRSTFDAAFAINSLHFIQYKDFQQRVEDFISCLRPGGVGFLSFNSARFMGMHDDLDIEKHVRGCLNHVVNVKWQVIDINTKLIQDEYNTGNIRLVFTRCEQDR